MKIYVASSWRNIYQQGIVTVLRSMGHEVYDYRHPNEYNNGFSWSSIDKDWREWTPQKFKESLSNPIAEKGFNCDFAAMQWADCCIMVLPCGRSAHSEAGWMKGAGKKVYVLQLQQEEPELMYKLYDDLIIDIHDLYKLFKIPTE